MYVYIIKLEEAQCSELLTFFCKPYLFSNNSSFSKGENNYTFLRATKAIFENLLMHY